jgi:hypothetical protein
MAKINEKFNRTDSYRVTMPAGGCLVNIFFADPAFICSIRVSLCAFALKFVREAGVFRGQNNLEIAIAVAPRLGHKISCSQGSVPPQSPASRPIRSKLKSTSAMVTRSS